MRSDKKENVAGSRATEHKFQEILMNNSMKFAISMSFETASFLAVIY